MNQDLANIGVLDLAFLLAAGLMLRAWRRRNTRPPLVAGVALIVLALVATILVLLGVPRGMIVGPTFIIALFVVLYSARFDRRTATPQGAKPKS